MPLLKFYTSPNQLTSTEKQDLAKIFTARYARAMPAFFVDIVFHEVHHLPLSSPFTNPLQVPEDSFFVGGEKTEGKFIRLTMEHIYVNFAKEGERGEAMTKTFLGFVGEVFKEKFEGRGWRSVTLGRSFFFPVSGVF